MKSLNWLPLLLPLSLFAADGDITGVAIESNGWLADVYIASAGAANTNGTFSNGFSAANKPEGDETFTLNVTSCGYNSSCATTTVSRVLYGTRIIRFPYPNNNYKDTTNDSGTLKIKVVLSGYVYSKDTISSAQIKAGMYATNSLTTAETTWETVTNNSTQGYFKSLARWTGVPNQRITANTFTVRAFGVHGEANDGKPLEAMKFVAQDGSGHSNVVTVTSMTKSRMTGDYIEFPEYIGTLDISSLDAGALFTVDGYGYPTIGDASSVVTTTEVPWPLTVSERPSPYFNTQTNYNDRLNAFTPYYAVVDLDTGSDANGTASLDYTTCVPCLTISNAFLKLSMSNYVGNSLSSNLNGGVVYLKAGTHTNYTTRKATNQLFWAETRPYPGLTSNEVFITTHPSMSGSTAPLWHIKDCTITGSGTYFCVSSCIWFDNCHINLTGTPGLSACSSYYTGSRIPRCFMTPYTTSTKGYTVLVRGCDLTGNTRAASLFCIVGNYKGPTSGITLEPFTTDGGSGPYIDGSIMAYNLILGHNSGTVGVIEDYATIRPFTNGIAYLNNVMEVNSSALPTASIWTLNGANANLTNWIVFNNTSLGGKHIWLYDWSSTDPGLVWKVGSFVKNNFISALSIKDDVFTEFNGERIGNWSARNGVAWSGNFIGNDIACEYPTYAGIGSYQVTGDVTRDYFGFVSHKSGYNYPSWNNGGGNGDYRLTESSPLRGVTTENPLPYDLAGNVRSVGDDAGAYIYVAATPPATPSPIYSPVRRFLRR